MYRDPTSFDGFGGRCNDSAKLEALATAMRKLFVSQDLVDEAFSLSAADRVLLMRMVKSVVLKTGYRNFIEFEEIADAFDDVAGIRYPGCFCIFPEFSGRSVSYITAKDQDGADAMLICGWDLDAVE